MTVQPQQKPEAWTSMHALKEATRLKGEASGTLGGVESAVQRARVAVQTGDWVNAGREIAAAEAGLGQAWRQMCAARDLHAGALEGNGS